MGGVFLGTWILRIALLSAAVIAALAGLASLKGMVQRSEERWVARIAIWTIIPAVAVYALGHLGQIARGARIDQGRAAYAKYGDSRRSEELGGELRGWLLDCTGADRNALVGYVGEQGQIVRRSFLGAAGTNFVGGDGARDYTIEQLYSDLLREPYRFGERFQLHPVGRDLRTTLCRDLTQQAWQRLQHSRRQGAIIVQDVATGGMLAYAATGDTAVAPLGIQQYATPGSVFKLALAALWWEADLPDTVMNCPATIRVGNATVRNAGGIGRGQLRVPEEMLVYSCNTAAIAMALALRRDIGPAELPEHYRRLGFLPYDAETPPRDTSFWASSSSQWKERMTPPPARLRQTQQTRLEELAQLAIGQGPVDITVVHISRFLQAIGNDGVMRSPSIEWDMAGESRRERIMSGSTARKLQAAMRDVVNRGTARGIRPELHGLDGWTLGGKTGTAQVAGARDDGWFTGLVFDPENKARFTVTVYLRGGGPGAAQPADIAAHLTRTLVSTAGWIVSR